MASESGFGSREAVAGQGSLRDEVIGPVWLRRGRLLRLAVALAVTMAALVLLGRSANLPLLRSALSTLWQEPHLIAAFVGCYTAAFWLRALAWRSLLSHKIGVLPLFRMLQAALFVNHLLPVKAGEVVRPFLAGRRGMPMTEAVTTTALARLLDFVSLLVIAAVLMPLAIGEIGTGTRALAIPALITILAVVIFIVLRASRREVWFLRPFGKSLQSFHTALRDISAPQIIRALVWTAPSWLLEAIVVLVAAQALGFEISIQAAVAVTSFTILFQLFHITPGGIGVYEGSMTGALVLYGLGADEALAIALLAHGLKFAYSFTAGFLFGSVEAVRGGRINLGGVWRRPKEATRLELLMARVWNVFNEGKPFTPVFVAGVLLLLSIPHLADPSYWLRAGIALVALSPLFIIFYRFDFPLKLRSALWIYLAAFLVAFRFLDPIAIAVVLAIYCGFTVGLWGTIYYHLRIGTPWTNFLRFWRLVVENPDTTSGNFLEQVPKALLLVLLFRYMVSGISWPTMIGVEMLVMGVALSAPIIHLWFFRWVPPPPLAPTGPVVTEGRRICRRFIAIVIDGCRVDRLAEAHTPFIDRLRRQGVEYTDMRTVYPARTVTCFSSMLTGAPPKVHGMKSNFAPKLGVKCDSLFTSLRRQGLNGALVGIAHLVDAFGDDVRPISSVRKNEEIDDIMAERARLVLEEEDPDLLVLQLISVDQTGHAYGSYNREYLERIEATDGVIEKFLSWCESAGYLEGATVLVTSDHGQGVGIGGHGHLTKTELNVPCILWGNGVGAGEKHGASRTLMDIAPTISYYLGASPPERSVGRPLISSGDTQEQQPVAVIIPAHNEAENLPRVLSRIPRQVVNDLRVVVVDDGSTDGTSVVARQEGADVVVRHDENRGLGAALRTGLETARHMRARAAIYLDADGEYDSAEIPRMLAPVQSGNADYILGSRFQGHMRGMPWHRRIGNYLLNLGTSVLAGRWLSDSQTGFRAFSEKALSVVEIVHDYNYAQVLTLNLLRKGMRLEEVPISYSRRKSGRSFIGGQYLWRVPLGIARELFNESG